MQWPINCPWPDYPIPCAQCGSAISENFWRVVVPVIGDEKGMGLAIDAHPVCREHIQVSRERMATTEDYRKDIDALEIEAKTGRQFDWGKARFELRALPWKIYLRCHN